jgi:hypothetical protein
MATKPSGKKPAADKKAAPKAAAKKKVVGWPVDKKEGRELRCQLTEAEIKQYGREQAEGWQAINHMEDDMKASAARYKSEIKAKQARCSVLSQYVTSGWIEREVPCTWMYEFKGRDEKGKYIPDPDKKILVRDDTGAVVTICPISDQERQLVFPLEDERKVPEPKKPEPKGKKAEKPQAPDGEAFTVLPGGQTITEPTKPKSKSKKKPTELKALADLPPTETAPETEPEPSEATEETPVTED